MRTCMDVNVYIVVCGMCDGVFVALLPILFFSVALATVNAYEYCLATDLRPSMRSRVAYNCLAEVHLGIVRNDVLA